MDIFHIKFYMFVNVYTCLYMIIHNYTYLCIKNYLPGSNYSLIQVKLCDIFQNYVDFFTYFFMYIYTHFFHVDIIQSM